MNRRVSASQRFVYTHQAASGASKPRGKALGASLLDQLFCGVHDILSALRPGDLEKNSTNVPNITSGCAVTPEVDVQLLEQRPRALVARQRRGDVLNEGRGILEPLERPGRPERELYEPRERLQRARRERVEREHGKIVEQEAEVRQERPRGLQKLRARVEIRPELGGRPASPSRRGAGRRAERWGACSSPDGPAASAPRRAPRTGAAAAA